MTLLIKNIGQLYGINQTCSLRLTGNAMKQFLSLKDSYLLIDNETICAFGSMTDAPEQADTVIDAGGAMVFPSFCDSHTHIVFADHRAQEFIDKINGLSYEEIARRGGGILNSAALLHNTSEDSLYHQALGRVNEMIARGTGAAEIKSGYGLSTADELKMLRVVRRLKETTPLTIKATFLGAHAVPAAYKGRQDDYVTLVCREMIPLVAGEGLADFIDVFCDEGFFTVEQTSRILEAGAKYGLRGKIHANELAVSGGVQVGVAHGALSVDHLERSGKAEFDVLQDADTMPTGLPGASFFLNIPYAPLRQMIDSGLGVALASDCNPGSSPSCNMKFILSLACIKMRLSPEEAFNAATINSAYAMGVSHTHGSVAIGKRANIFITKGIPSLDYIPYAYTRDMIGTVILNGKIITGK
ncbi:MAG: imidazolonepropionase [Prevotellaceae bacterium]|jgi:imidazolonepropionase|nr:imidazolonepropionase [Prevotellaceae bacterium]